jgi:hypothetical protein
MCAVLLHMAGARSASLRAAPPPWGLRKGRKTSMNRRQKLVEAIKREESIPISYGPNTRTRRIIPVEIQGELLLAKQTMGYSKSGDRRGLKTFKVSKVHVK